MIVHAQRDLAEQLDEAAVGVIAETLVTGQLDQASQRLFVQTQIEDGVHHAWHGHRGTRAHRDQQRVAGTAKLLAGFLLQPSHVFAHTVHQPLGQAVVGDVIQTGLGGNHEAWRHP